MIAGRGRQRIRPPRRGLHGDEIDFENTWSTIASAFREIHTKNASRLSYEELYRHAYKVVLKKKGEELYKRVCDFEHEWLSSEVRSAIQALFSPNLSAGTQSLGGTTANERRVAGEKFFKGLKQAWGDHQICMSMLADVLMYMDRVYCHDHRRPSIYTAAMVLFRDDILHAPTSDVDGKEVLRLLNHVILDQIQMERDGDVIDKHLIKSCVHMLDSLYQDEDEAEDQRLYNTSFEAAYLETSREFYRQEADFLLRDSDAGAYCRHTRRRLYEEEERCRSTLLDVTQPKIQQVVEDELIKNRIHELVEMESGVRFMIDNDRLDELNLIYDLNSRVDDKKAELMRAIQKRIVELGTDINNAAIAASQAPVSAPMPLEAGDKVKAQMPEKSLNQQTVAAIRWVEDVLQLKDKFDKIWEVSFQQDQPLQTALTRSFADFINSPAFPRSSEYISLFIDENMKKGIKGKTEMEVDAVLEKAIILLRYVQDKDLFERYYKKHLCRRLLMNKSISNDVEKAMISKMKIELGNNFTLKLESMFKDMTISEELTSGFKKHVEGLGDKDPKRIELAINVLTSMTWPLETMGSGDDAEGSRPRCIYPTAIERIKRGFEKYYNEKHSGRQLTWLGNMGSADIKAVFPKVPQKDGSFKERRHDLNVSTYGMVILLLFNDLPADQHLTFEEIQAQTNIPKTDLIRNLQSLAVAPKTRILIKDPMSKDVKSTDRFFFNEGFIGRFVKIKVGVVSSGNKVESDRERRETEKKNDDSRGFCIEAAVVRIMKQRKELSHQALIIETLNQLVGQFKPEVNMIKKKIESLIEREYLERVEGVKIDSYRYLA
ncbi:Cullin-domain-containing protein [Lindgomyces ingoldianus]|uniref:Cullin-domain-containing protein n=1 Tax=Lindgomyces ingoldianus TaxID=673940 RepID=A0ACB6RGQ0_9PLEO|nr:Cullin-domain-containing protein [Lindgomyces ingoldianus]KAF2477687.1 Cullin-domain-containing protein [Lindgomyces ingoldianus]